MCCALATTPFAKNDRRFVMLPAEMAGLDRLALLEDNFNRSQSAAIVAPDNLMRSSVIHDRTRMSNHGVSFTVIPSFTAEVGALE